MNPLRRRLTALEGVAWDRRKRQILRDAFAEVARDRQWTDGQLEQKMQAGFDEFTRLEPELKAMLARRATLREVVTYIADGSGIDVADLIAEAERTGVIGRDTRR